MLDCPIHFLLEYVIKYIPDCSIRVYQSFQEGALGNVINCCAVSLIFLFATLNSVLAAVNLGVLESCWPYSMLQVTISAESKDLEKYETCLIIHKWITKKGNKLV